MTNTPKNQLMNAHRHEPVFRLLAPFAVAAFAILVGCTGGETTSTPGSTPPASNPGGVPGGGDTSAPTIGNVTVTNVTETSATVTWTTNENSTSGVDYGPTTSYGSNASGASGVNHSVSLSGLSANTTYHYRVSSADAAGNTASSADASFTTPVSTTPPDTVPPILSSISVTNVTATSATVSWVTNEASSTQAQFGTTSSYGSVVNGASGVTSHSVNLTGLASGTLYHYRVVSVDAANNSAASTNATFTTSAAPPPATGSITLEWSGSTANAGGSTPLTDLAGYRVYRATRSASTCATFSQVHQVTHTTPGGTLQATIQNIPVGTYCFIVTAFDTQGGESTASNQLVETISN